MGVLAIFPCLRSPRVNALARKARALAARGLLPVILFTAGLGLALPVNSWAAGEPMQDFALVEQAVTSFLMQQTEGLPGQVSISLTPAAPRGLAACPALEPFIPPGVRLWGRAMVGVRCNGEKPWTIYLQARIGVVGNYYVAAHTLNPGATISLEDLTMQQGDLTTLPAAIVTNPSQAVGSTTLNMITAGLPVRTDLLKAGIAVRFGQQVRLVAQGNGFSVSSEGSAMANGSVGQSIRVKMASGAIVSGVIQSDASVQVPL